MNAPLQKISSKDAKAQRQIVKKSFALFVFCLLLIAGYLLPTAFSSAPQDTQPVQSPSPQPSPTPAPSPSPTPFTGLHQWGAVTLFHGLPSDRVHTIAQDLAGAMWFGTEAGLARFDGRRTQTITDPQLPTGRVLALQSDPDGAIWIGTESGAARYEGGRFESLKELNGQTVNAIISPDRGHAIMATEQGMIYECRHQSTPPNVEGPIKRDAVDLGITTKQLLPAPLQSADVDHPGLLPLTSLALAGGKLLAGSMSRGLLQIDRGAVTSIQPRKPVYFIRALATDAQGQVWLGAKTKKDEPGTFSSGGKGEGKSNSVNGESNSLAQLDAPTGPVAALQRGTQDDMWVGSDGHGVFHFSDAKKIERFTFDGTAGGLRSDHVYAIFIDREEVVWFGTDRGVCRYDSHAPRVESVGDNPESNFVRTLYRTADGHVLCGTNRGLFVYDRETWRLVNSLGRNIIYAIAEDKRGRLLIGSASGLYIGQGRSAAVESQAFEHVEAASGNVDAVGSVRSFAEFHGATYIASFHRGIERLDGSHPQLVWPHDDSSPREAITVFADRDKRLLIGTVNDGVLAFDGEQATSESTLATLKGAAVRSIERTRDGVLWFATSRGIYLCRPNAECALTGSGYEARSVVTSWSAKESEIWGATTTGLLKIRVDDALGPIVSQLDIEQGLPSQNVFAVLPPAEEKNDEKANGGQDVRAPSGELLIGTSRGVVRYTPAMVTPTLFASRIISKRVHLPAELQSGLNLEYPQNSLLLDVTATSSRTFPEQFQYAFQLADGAGKIVRQKLAHDSQFTIEGLKPGKYKVTVRAFTKDLVASDPLVFQLNVAGAPFPWTSTALAVLLALTLMALVWAIFEHRRIVRTSEALVVANRDLASARFDLANEAERERRRIARDLHDQTLADLRRLLLITDKIPVSTASGSDRLTFEVDNSNASFDPALFRREIESVSNEIRRICEDLSPSVLDNVGLTAALEWALATAVAHLPPERQFTYEVSGGDDIEEQIKLAPGERIQIYRIAQEIINNICRHSQAQQVRLCVSVADAQTLVLTIEDDGPTFAPSGTRAEGRGLANIHARASLIEAEVSWATRNAGGTIFSLRKDMPPAS